MQYFALIATAIVFVLASPAGADPPLGGEFVVATTSRDSETIANVRPPSAAEISPIAERNAPATVDAESADAARADASNRSARKRALIAVLLLTASASSGAGH